MEEENKNVIEENANKDDVGINGNEPVVINVEKPVEEQMNDQSVFKSEKTPELNSNKNKKNGSLFIILILIVIGAFIFFLPNVKFNKNNTSSPKIDNNNKKIDENISNSKKDENKNSNDSKQEENNSKETTSIVEDNSMIKLDIDILKQNNNSKNFVYSPISLKTTLKMIEEGTEGDSKTQISNLLNNYKVSKYVNSSNLIYANALFIKNSFKKDVKKNYINKLKSDYLADIVYSTFANPDEVNKWVSDKTFNKINNMFDDVSDNNFILLNTTAIDMEWKNRIMYRNKFGDWGWNAQYTHIENYSGSVRPFENKFDNLLFNNNLNVNSLPIQSIIFKYDIVNDIGENNIRSTVGLEYEKWLDGLDEKIKESCKYKSTDEFLNDYIDSFKNNFSVNSSTDYGYYYDNDVKAFAKDLKEYNGVQLQYIGIMPIKESLNTYINSINIDKINSIINGIVNIELKSDTNSDAYKYFKQDVITQIDAKIPMFKMEYSYNLIDDLKMLGITDIFDNTNSLKGITNKEQVITEFKQKNYIEFSNDGIKAVSATGAGAGGGASCPIFDYKYDIPKERIEYIDFTFDKPYMYIIRNKNTGEIWFMGTVYEPTEYTK